jgi:lycopene beta-cyclase
MAEIYSDVTIIGGGCSGLSLGYYYAKKNIGNKKITIIEERNKYSNDKSWCFWLEKNSDFIHRDIINKTWKIWRFSNRKSIYKHQSSNFEYCFIPSNDFYNKTTEAIYKDKRQNILLNEIVKTINFTETNSYVHTENHILKSKIVIDTRPILKDENMEAPVFQIFFGLEIESESNLFNPEEAGLMEDLQSSRDRIGFLYILPFSNNRALLEYTIFSNSFIKPEYLKDSLVNNLNSRNMRPYKILRSESGVLPMGLKVNARKSKDFYLRAGIASGNLRTSTGYGFLRIQKWAKHVALNISENNSKDISAIRNYFYDNRKQQFFDSLFIKVLKNDMYLGENIFLNIGRKMTADGFARFMSETAQAYDYLNLAMSVPKWPFLKALISR